MTYCTRCGQPSQPGTLFCTTCGTRLSPPPAPAAPAPAAPAPFQAPFQARQFQQEPPPVPPQRQEQPVRPPRPRPPQPPRPPRGPRRGDGGPPLWAIVTGAILIVAICAAVVTIVVISSSPTGHVKLSSNTTSPSTPQESAAQESSAPQSPTQQQSNAAGTGQPSGTAQAPSEQTAAQDLATLLSQSATDRSAISSAVSDVNNCGPNLAADASAFQQAASSRQRLLGKLAQLPGSSALPAQLVQDLTGAWQSSRQADQDFAAWANDENTNGCTPNDSSDANFQAATAPDNQATTDKKAFVSEWTPIASQYGLRAYQWDQI